ncbi:MAG: glycosyltransferase family 2 protein [bacterium]|nr:glycosyltransferase family 2 protein [bacterium]
MGKIAQENFVPKIRDFINDYSNIKLDYEKRFNEPINSDPYLSINSFPLSYCKYKVSIVISTWNSANTVLFTLHSIENTYICQNYCDKLEVVLVDDGSSDNTEEIILKEKFKFKLLYIKQEHMGRAQGINLGCKYATGEMIIFCDSDIILFPFTLDEIIKRQQEYLDETIFFGFREDIENAENIKNVKKFVFQKTPNFWLDNRFSTDFSGSWGTNMMAETHFLQNLPCIKNFWVSNNIISMYDCWQLYRMVYGFLFAVSKKNFKEVGGFSEFLIGWGCDDTSFVSLCIEKGIKIIPVPSATCCHIKHPIRMKTQWEDGKKNEKKMNDYLSNSLRIDYYNQELSKRIIKRVEINPLNKKEKTIKKYNIIFKTLCEEARYNYYLGNFEKSKSLYNSILNTLDVNDLENYFDCLIHTNDYIIFESINDDRKYYCFFYYLGKLYFDNLIIDYDFEIKSNHIYYLNNMKVEEHMKRANQYYEEKQWYLALMDLFASYMLTKNQKVLLKCLNCINMLKKT